MASIHTITDSYTVINWSKACLNSTPTKRKLGIIAFPSIAGKPITSIGSYDHKRVTQGLFQVQLY